jgi:hypothetical protein
MLPAPRKPPDAGQFVAIKRAAQTAARLGFYGT